MTSPRRKVTIRLTPRDISDLPELLSNVADAFKDADFEIDLNQERSAVEDSERTETREDTVLEQEVTANTKGVLELENQAVDADMTSVESTEESQSKTADFLKVIRNEGARITVSVLLRKAIDRIMDAF